MPPSPRGPGLIAALGVTQILGYGTVFYAYPVLVPAIAASFGTSHATLYAILSVGLFAGGLAAPRLGRMMDRFQPPRVMAAGSLLVGALMGALALAPGLAVFAVLVVLLQALSFAVLYDAAFATLALRRPEDTRRAITRLTLIAGFASTLFWPLAGWLVDVLGWRGAWAVFATLNLGLALPLHLWLAVPPRWPPPPPGTVPRTAPEATAGPTPDRSTAPPGVAQPGTAPDWPVLQGPQADRAFVLLGAGFALTGMLIAALAVQIVPVLLARGLAEGAYLAAMAMGPAQVAIRIVDATLWRNRHPLWVAVISAGLVVVALAALLLPGPPLAMAVLFAVLYGAGQGLASIVRGAVPVALFGTQGLGLRLGRLASLRNMLGALAPFLFALGSQTLGTGAALVLTALVGLAGLAATVRLWILVRPA